MPKNSLLLSIIKKLIPLIILVVAGILAWYYVSTTPTAGRRQAMPSVPQVQVQSVKETQVPIIIRALGTIVPAEEISLRSRVSGQIIAINPNLVPGNIVKAGEVLVTLDPKDLANEVRSKQNSYDRSKADLDLEMGQQTVAQTELKHLESLLPNRSNSSSLALREPQLAQAKANLAIAETALIQAKDNLTRTKIEAPFDAIVIDRKVALGASVGTQDVLATLVNINNYWIDVAIALDRVQMINYTKQNNAPAIINLSNGKKREGELLRITGNISGTGRMAKAIVDITDPLALKDETLTPLLLGDQVSIEIIAEEKENTIIIPREALRSGDTVWVVSPENTLDIRYVEVYWKDTNNVYLTSGLKDAEKIVISNLGAPIQNMPVRPYE